MNQLKTTTLREIHESLANAKTEKDLLTALDASDNLPCRKEQKELNLLIIDMLEEKDQSLLSGTAFNPKEFMKQKGIKIQPSLSKTMLDTVKNMAERFNCAMKPVPMSKEFKERMRQTEISKTRD